MRVKVTTLRLPESLAVQLGAVTRTEGIPASEFVREAIENHIALRCSDEDFKERLRQRMAEDHEALRRLGLEE
jgi:predicted DNA-binding protein